MSQTTNDCEKCARERLEHLFRYFCCLEYDRMWLFSFRSNSLNVTLKSCS